MNPEKTRRHLCVSSGHHTEFTHCTGRCWFGKWVWGPWRSWLQGRPRPTNPPRLSPPRCEGQRGRRMKGRSGFSCWWNHNTNHLWNRYQASTPQHHGSVIRGKTVFKCSRTKHNNHLYEGRRDRISLRFWESVTLSTDSCESSLSATVEIWERQQQWNTQNREQTSAPLSAGLLLDSFVFVCVHLHSLDLWGLDNRGLCSLNDPVDLNRLSVWELHQCYRRTCCWGMACCHGDLKFRCNCGTTLTLTTAAVMLYTICYLCQSSDLCWCDLLAGRLGRSSLHPLLSLLHCRLHLHLLN